MTGLTCDRAVGWGLAGLILFTPLAFGTVEPWALTLMEWGIVTLFLLHAFGLAMAGPAREGRPATRLRALAIPIALFLAFGMLQTVPIPVAWLARVSPGASRLYRTPDLRFVIAAAFPGTGSTAEAIPGPVRPIRQPGRRPVSLNPEATWARLRLVTALACLFFLAAGWARTQDRVLFLLKSVIAVGFLVAIEGLIQFMTWNGKIYWVRKVPPSSAFGPFVNHNHFAGYVGMIIPVAIAMGFFLHGRRRSSGGVAEAPAGPSALILFATAIMVVSLFLSTSRGGILSCVVSGLILILLLWRSIPSRLAVLAVALGIPVLAATLILWIGAGGLVERFSLVRELDKEASLRSRVVVWKGIIDHLPDVIWTGAGLGAFEDSFAPYTPPGASSRWDRAHNDYLQLLWETGLWGAILWLITGILFVRRYCWPALIDREGPPHLLELGIVIGLLSIALHSVVDFNLQIGANGFLCALLAGLLVALRAQADAASVRRLRPMSLESSAR